MEFFHTCHLCRILEDAMKALTLAAGLLTATTALAETPVLTIYTYDSFVSDWGPGPLIEKAFEETCACDLKFVAAGDGASLLARLLLEGERSDADIVLGLDTNLTQKAAESNLFATHSVNATYTFPDPWTDPLFVPYDWGLFAFVHNGDLTAPTNFRALAESDLKIVIQDPRSSTPGLGLLMWVKDAYGDEAAQIWSDLSDNILTVTKGWSESYGLFLSGEADMVLSYSTSPAYHLVAESDDTKKAALFDEGHYMQIEVAGKLKSSNHSDLADRFLDFMVSDGFQSAIPHTNWMYRAVSHDGTIPNGFEGLIKPEKTLMVDPKQASNMRDEALSEWLTALSK